MRANPAGARTAMTVKVHELDGELHPTGPCRPPTIGATGTINRPRGGSMKRLLLAASLALLSLSSVAIAKGHGHGGHGGGGPGWDHPPGNHYGWHKGERVDVVYLQPRYYVEDYREYRLAPPPPGHRWIRDPDGRFILVA